MTRGSRAINEPSSSGVAMRSSTGWFAVVDKDGKTIFGGRLFGSNFRAAEWASERLGKPWPQLHKLGFSVRGGYEAKTGAEQ